MNEIIIRPMQVYLHEVSIETQKAVIEEFLEAIRMSGPHGLRRLEQALRDRGIPADASYRCADRLVQKLRKAGYVSWNGNAWMITNDTEGEIK